MKTTLRIIISFLAAVLSASVLASLFSTQFVVYELQMINVDIPIATRLSMTIKDLRILETMLIVVGASFLVGFLVATLCHRKLPGNRIAWYSVVGGCALLSTLLLISYLLQLMPVAGARTTFGLATQTLAGVVGGYVFAKLSRNAATATD